MKTEKRLDRSKIKTDFHFYKGYVVKAKNERPELALQFIVPWELNTVPQKSY